MAKWNWAYFLENCDVHVEVHRSYCSELKIDGSVGSRNKILMKLVFEVLCITYLKSLSNYREYPRVVLKFLFWEILLIFIKTFLVSIILHFPFCATVIRNIIRLCQYSNFLNLSVAQKRAKEIKRKRFCLKKKCVIGLENGFANRFVLIWKPQIYLMLSALLL